MTTLADVIEEDAEGHLHTRPDGDWKPGENCRPIRDRVIIQRDNPDIVYKGTTIQVPDKVKGKSPRCKVIAAGPKCTEVKDGDVVYVNTWAGEPIHHDDMPRLFVVLEEDIEAVEE